MNKILIFGKALSLLGHYCWVPIAPALERFHFCDLIRVKILSQSLKIILHDFAR